MVNKTINTRKIIFFFWLWEFGKVTTGLVESKRQPTTGFMTNVNCGLTAKKVETGISSVSNGRKRVWDYFPLAI